MTISSINEYVYITLESFEKNTNFSQGYLAVGFKDFNIGDTVIFRSDITPVKEKLPPNNLEVLRFSEKSIYMIILKK